MNSYGLGKGVNRFWLGIPYSGLAASWQEIVRFVSYIRQQVKFNVER